MLVLLLSLGATIGLAELLSSVDDDNVNAGV